VPHCKMHERISTISMAQMLRRSSSRRVPRTIASMVLVGAGASFSMSPRAARFFRNHDQAESGSRSARQHRGDHEVPAASGITAPRMVA